MSSVNRAQGGSISSTHAQLQIFILKKVRSKTRCPFRIVGEAIEQESGLLPPVVFVKWTCNNANLCIPDQYEHQCSRLQRHTIRK